MRESRKKKREERVIPEDVWWVLCSYSSNQYPAETDHKDQEMRNINEEVEEQNEGREWWYGGCYRAYSSSLFVYCITFSLSSLHFNPSFLFLPSVLLVSSTSLVFLLSLHSQYGDSIHFTDAFASVGKWLPSSTELYNRMISNGSHWSSVWFWPEAPFTHCSNYWQLNWEAFAVDAAVHVYKNTQNFAQKCCCKLLHNNIPKSHNIIANNRWMG